MPSCPQPTTTPDELVEALRPVIEKYRDEADEIRRLPDELLGHLRDSGAFRLTTPRELGGFELSLTETAALLERLARIDGATAWTAWNFNAGFSAAFLPEESVERIWADGPDPLIGHSSQPGRLVPDGAGFLLSGEWKLVSGADSAQWLALLAVVVEDGRPRMTAAGPDVRFCLVPRSAVQVRDTWHSTGLRGTNTNAVVAVDVPVDAAMMVSPGAPARISRRRYRVAAADQLSSGAAAVVLGIARAAVDEVAALAHTRTGPDGVPVARQPRVQAALGQAATRVHAALALLRTALDGLDTAAGQERPATEAERAALGGAFAHAAETARAVLTSMYELAGSTALYESSRVGKLLRDGYAAAQHALLSPANYEAVGTAIAGASAPDRAE
ncbi:acyl-CoA dehydrogenase family protein [Lentzea sp. NPDC060358]|uniref:acyl-CoA dehydrogenase family protein n=1 Tax=Lentzea sp. NPDC060358 TaxID=3347103 RepID=UPI00364767DE